MGSGSSAQKSKYKDKLGDNGAASYGAGVASIKSRAIDRGDSSDETPLGRRPSNARVNSKDRQRHDWHQTNCKATDMLPAHTIREAFPMDDNVKKTASRKELVLGIDDDARRGYGKVQYSERDPVKLYYNGHTAVYPNMRAALSSSGRHAYNAQLRLPSISDDPMGRCSSKAKPARGLDGFPVSTSFPSGKWKGTYVEGGNKRATERLITFLADGSLAGRDDAEGCTLCGTVSSSTLTHYSIDWKESHAWGVLTVTGKINAASRRCKITGTFTSSDGGTGKVELAPI